MALSGRQFSISAGDYDAVVVEVGAGLRALRHGGVDVTATYADDELPPKGCGITLVPWPNRIRGGRYTFDGVACQLPLTDPAKGNAIHGLGRWVRWTPLVVDVSTVTLALDIVPQTGWPFEVRVEVTYALDPVTGLAVTTVARNAGRTRAPFGAGFHPYFSIGSVPLDEVTIRLPARHRLILDESGIPVGASSVAGTQHDLRRGRRLNGLRMDDAFSGLYTPDGRGSAEVRTRHGGAQLWFDATFGCLQVFTPDDWAHGRPAVAIEPMTCPPDAFNTGDGLIVLDPGGVWSGSWGIAPLAR